MNSSITKNRLAEPTQPPPTISFDLFLESVANFLAARTPITVSDVGPDFDFVAAGLLDSISMIELFFFLQDTFDQSFLSGEIKVAEMNTPAKLYRRYLDVKSKSNDSE